MRNALWERLHLRLVSARALPVQLARTRTSLGLLFARCACRESFQMRRVQRVSVRVLCAHLVRIRINPCRTLLSTVASATVKYSTDT